MYNKEHASFSSKRHPAIEAIVENQHSTEYIDLIELVDTALCVTEMWLSEILQLNASLSPGSLFHHHRIPLRENPPSVWLQAIGKVLKNTNHALIVINKIISFTSRHPLPAVCPGTLIDIDYSKTNATRNLSFFFFLILINDAKIFFFFFFFLRDFNIFRVQEVRS
jgi:hypothetical protein